MMCAYYMRLVALVKRELLFACAHRRRDPFREACHVIPQRAIERDRPEQRRAKQQQDPNPADYSIFPEPHEEGKNTQP